MPTKNFNNMFLNFLVFSYSGSYGITEMDGFTQCLSFYNSDDNVFFLFFKPLKCYIDLIIYFKIYRVNKNNPRVYEYRFF